ncbi:MAG: polysaccharide deacetylase family protein [Firmicutes bacterium]|nr:polysaccharide deacetylase family protein [Bacillota bacterium]
MVAKKYLILLIVIAALFAPPLWWANLNHSQKQANLKTALDQATADVSPALPAYQAPDLIKLPAPNDKTLSIPILMYHEISVGPDLMWVSDQNFRAQMQYLHDNGYQTITLAQARELLAGHFDTNKKVVLTFDDGYSTFYTNAWPILKELNQTATLFVISGLVGNPEYVTWDQIRFLISQGIEIGGHTRTHPLLPTLTTQAAIAEISGSKQDIEAQLGQSISSFCYPTGKYNSQIVEQVKMAGYTSAVTMVQRKASSDDNLLLLPRWGVYQNDSRDHFVTLIQ